MINLKRICSILLAIVIMSGFTVCLQADSEISVYVNNNIVAMDNKPQIINGTTLVPFRNIVEAMGGAVSWYGETKTINITLGNYLISMQIDNKNIAKKSTRNSDGQLTNDSEVSVIECSVPPQIINGSTYIPLRVMAEAVDANVDWNGDTRTIYITTSASSASSGSVGYYVNGDTLTITGSGAMEDFDGLKEDTYKSIMPSDIKNIVISEGITHVGSYAFANFQNITNISLPSSIKSIGKSAFSHCQSLTTAELNSGLKTIDDYAFFYTNLSSIEIPYGVESIGHCAFYACKNLTSVTVPETVTSIDAEAFDLYYKNIKTVKCKKGSTADNAALYPEGITFIYE